MISEFIQSFCALHRSAKQRLHMALTKRGKWITRRRGALYENVDFVQDIVDYGFCANVLQKIYSYYFMKQMKCHGCMDMFGVCIGHNEGLYCFRDVYFNESKTRESKVNYVRHFMNIAVIKDEISRTNMLCDSCYEAMFGNSVSLFKQCDWRLTHVYRVRSAYSIDVWVYHTGGMLIDDIPDNGLAFKTYLLDEEESLGFVCYKVLYFDSLGKGSFRKCLIQSKIYNSDVGHAIKNYIDKFYISFGNFGFWVERELAVDIFSSANENGIEVWNDLETMIYKRSVIYANICHMVVSRVYPTLQYPYSKFRIKSDGSIHVTGQQERRFLIQLPSVDSGSEHCMTPFHNSITRHWNELGLYATGNILGRLVLLEANQFNMIQIRDEDVEI